MLNFHSSQTLYFESSVIQTCVWTDVIFNVSVSEWLLFNSKLTIFFGYVMQRTSCTEWNHDGDVSFVLDHHT